MATDKLLSNRALMQEVAAADPRTGLAASQGAGHRPGRSKVVAVIARIVLAAFQKAGLRLGGRELRLGQEQISLSK